MTQNPIQQWLIDSIDLGPNDDDISRIHDLILILIKYERWENIDLLLRLVNPRKVKIDILLSFLVATSWCKKHLKERDKFFKKASWRIDCMMEKGLLEGLE